MCAWDVPVAQVLHGLITWGPAGLRGGAGGSRSMRRCPGMAVHASRDRAACRRAGSDDIALASREVACGSLTSKQEAEGNKLVR